MYGVLNYLDVSTRHITEATLNSNSIYKLGEYAEGAFFWVDEELPPSLPKDLYEVFEFAKEKNCTIIRFDADGFDHPELPSYDW
jgi:hypothetical protein